MTLQQKLTVILVALPVLIVGGFMLFLKYWAKAEAAADRQRRGSR